MLGDRFDKVAIIVSTGRTATKAIAHYFDACYDNVWARHEPFPSRPLRFASNLYLCDRIGRSGLKSLVVLCRRPTVARVRASIYLEANFFYHGCLDVLDEVFGNVRVCHIVRHPGHQVTSYINFGVFRGLKGFAGAHVPFWLLKPEHSQQGNVTKWNDMTERERLAWRWNTINTNLNRGERLFPGRYLRIKFEELFEGREPGINQLARWLDLDPRPELTQRAKTTPIHASQYPLCPTWEDWDAQSREGLLETCGPLMQLYGYEA